MTDKNFLQLFIFLTTTIVIAVFSGLVCNITHISPILIFTVAIFIDIAIYVIILLLSDIIWKLHNTFDEFGNFNLLSKN